MSTIALSPLDHVFVGAGSYPIEFVFEYDSLLDPDLLSAGLARVVTDFPPITSHLVRLSAHQYGFQSGAEVPVLRVAHSDQSLDDWSEASGYIDSVCTREMELLFRAKLTQTSKGSVLGISFSHAIGDGFSFFYFLSSWCKAVKGEEWTPPCHDRNQLIRPLPDPLPDVTAQSHPTGFFRGRKRENLERSQIQWHRHLFGEDDLQELLAEARDACDVRLSHNAVVAAYLWKTYVPRWGSPTGEPQAFVHCPVDFRRFDRAVLRSYFGNAVCMATAAMDFSELQHASLGAVAVRIHEAIRAVRSDAVATMLESLEVEKRRRNVEAMESIHIIHPETGLLVTNLSRLPLNQLDFGAGVPAALHILTPAQRGAVILPSHAGWDVRVCAPANAPSETATPAQR